MTATPTLAQPNKPLSRKQLAEFLEVSTDTVDRMTRDGCPRFWINRRPRYLAAFVTDWMQKRKRA